MKKIVLVIAVILVLLGAGLFYVNKVLLPVQVKAMAIKAAGDALGRKVNFDRLSYNPLRGFMVTDLTIYAKDKPEDVFIHADSASVQVLFLALLQKKLILPAVRVDALAVHMIRQDAVTWNFSDLLTPRGPAPAKPDMDIIVSGIEINNARVKVTDLAKGEPFTEEITPINIRGSVSLMGGYYLTADVRIPATNGSLEGTARGSVNSRTASAAIKATSIDASRYFRFIPAGIPCPVQAVTVASLTADLLADKDHLSVSGAVIMKNIDATPANGTRVRGDLTLDRLLLSVRGSEITLQSGIDLRHAQVALGDDRSLSADIKTSDTRAALKDGTWSASTDAEIKNLVARLDADRKLTADIIIPGISAAPSGKGISISGDVFIKNSAFNPGKDQNISGAVAFNKLVAAINGSDIAATADIVVDGLRAAIPGTTVAASLSAPGTALTLRRGDLEVSLAPAFKTLDVQAPQDLSFSGTPEGSVHVLLPATGSGVLAYDGTLRLDNGTLKGLPAIGEAKNIKTRLSFSADNLKIDALSLQALGIPVTAEGTVINFSAPECDLSVSAPDIDVSDVEKLVPQVIKDNGLALRGRASVTATVKGKVAHLVTSGINATAVLNNVSVNSSKLKQSLKNINGTVTYKAPGLSWKDLSIDFQKKTYVLNGYLDNLQDPLVATSVKSENLNVDVQARKTGDAIGIETLSVTLFDSSLTASGKVLLPPGKEPAIDITAESSVSLRDIPKILPDQQKLFDQTRLSGILKVTARIKGAAADWQHWTGSYTVATPALQAMGYHVNDIQLTADQKDGSVKPFDLKAKVYNGDLNVTGSLDLTAKDFPFDSTIKLENADLEEIKKDVPALKDRQMTGLLSVSGTMKGQPTDIKSLAGKLVFGITNGHLWDVQVLSNVLTILSSSFQGGDMVITDASATTTIQEGRVETNDLTLKSTSVTLLGEGWIDMLDQTLDMNITPRLETPVGGGNAATLISAVNPTSGLVNIHVTGTLQQPKISHNISAPSLIKKTLQNTVGGLLKLFE